MFYNSYYFVLVIIPLLIGMWAQHKVNSTYKRYSNVACGNGLTGRQAARQILDQNGLRNVQIEQVRGNLTDHYDPKNNVVRLSEGVYNSHSVAAVGVAAHECGHAVQYATGYVPMKIRGAIVPITNFGSKLAVPLVLIGLLLNWYPLAWIGLIGYGLIALFQLVTLPVEFNASNRAVAALTNMNMTETEQQGVKKVLSAAAMTYVAALISAITQLLRMISSIGGRDRRR